MKSVKDNLKNLETLLNVLSELNESYQTNFEPKLLSELANTILTYHEHQFGTWNPQIMESHEVKEMLGSFLKEIEPQVKEELLKSKVKWEEKVKKINSEQIAWNELINLGNQKERNANEVKKIEELIGTLTFLGLNHKPSFKRSIAAGQGRSKTEACSPW